MPSKQYKITPMIGASQIKPTQAVVARVSRLFSKQCTEAASAAKTLPMATKWGQKVSITEPKLARIQGMQ